MSSSRLRSIPARSTLLPRLAGALLAAALIATPSVSAQFCEQDGLVVIEVESVPPAGSWSSETNVNDYTGPSFYRWAGSNQFNSPGQGVLSYTIEISEPGDYQMRFRNHHDDPDSTMENDAWTRMDGGTWTKTYSKFAGSWVWSTRFEHSHDDKEDAHYVLSAGTHTFQISGRSNDFRIDRIHFYKGGSSGGTDHNQPQTTCGSWADLGQSLPGSNGAPVHTGEGEAAAGNTLTLELNDAPGHANGVLVVGFSELGFPFKGGTIVPALDQVLPMKANGNGRHVLNFVWSTSIASGTTMYTQYWVVDSASPQGVAASNAVSLTAP